MVAKAILSDIPYPLLLGKTIMALKAEGVNQTPSNSSRVGRDCVLHLHFGSADREVWGVFPLPVSKKNLGAYPEFANKYVGREVCDTASYSRGVRHFSDLKGNSLVPEPHAREISSMPILTREQEAVQCMMMSVCPVKNRDMYVAMVHGQTKSGKCTNKVYDSCLGNDKANCSQEVREASSLTAC